MTGKQLRKLWRQQGRNILLAIIGLALLGWLMLHRLGLLTGGVSATEIPVAHSTIGWHGLYDHPLNFPLEVIRSVVYYIFPKHGAFLIRLPSAVMGSLAVIAMAILLKLWHGNRTAFFGTILFATSAWTLHVSRLAGSHSSYILAVPALLLLHVLFQRFAKSATLLIIIGLCWSLLLTIPGLIWLVIWSLVWQKQAIVEAWHSLARWWQKLLAGLAGIIWLPIVSLDVWHHHQDIYAWLGAPTHWAAPLSLLKQWGAVFFHLFVRGPQQPDLWLGRAPLLDAFTLICCLLGIYFYILKFSAARSKLLGGYLLIGSILVAIGGPVSLGVLVPLLYVFAATGITYLLRQWLTVFPINPLARNLGIGLVAVVVALASVYNLRAYFVAWPHNPATKASFNHHL